MPPTEQRNPLAFTLLIRLHGRETFFGPGVADLMGLVQKTGSLHSAAKEMGMAYSKAWRVIEEAERELGYSLMCRRAGGSKGGGSELTEEGRQLLERYWMLEREAYRAVGGLFHDIFPEGTGPREQRAEYRNEFQDDGEL